MVSLYLTVMLALPFATPVTTPATTVATSALLVDHSAASVVSAGVTVNNSLRSNVLPISTSSSVLEKLAAVAGFNAAGTVITIVSV